MKHRPKNSTKETNPFRAFAIGKQRVKSIEERKKARKERNKRIKMEAL